VLRSLRHLIAFALAAAALGLMACGGSGGKSATPAQTAAGAATPGASSSAFPVQIPRSDGKMLTLDQEPRRIVSLSPGATEIIYALGADGELAAVDKNADFPQGAKDFATKVDAFEPNVEAIAALKPDLVFVATDVNGLVAALDRLSIPVLFSDLNDVTTLEDVYGQISLLGQATGKTSQAAQLVAGLRAREKRVTDMVAGVTGQDAKRVYHEVDDTYYTVSDATFIGDLYRLLKAKNIAGDGGGSPYPQLTQEQIIAADPQVIVLADEAFGTTVDSVKARAGWQNISAVKTGAIYSLDPDIISRAGPRILDALEQLARDLYPESR
jgi:iron complex transport system substrate-binding protein